MKFYFQFILILFSFTTSFSQQKKKNVQITTFKEDSIYSHYLQRQVQLSLIIPNKVGHSMELLLCNDGQDFPALHLQPTIDSLLAHHHTKAFLTVGIHANDNRINEYGTAAQADYKNRGNRAGLHALFVINELIPYLEHHYAIQRSSEARVFAGFSLGGLSAFDIVWHNAQVFAKTGVFSGALWWRQKAEEDGYTDEHDRIIHKLVKAGLYKHGLKFWFQAGTNDEKDDRNNNGVIDAIDDTLDLIAALKAKGYHHNDVHYHEVAGGEHNPHTWGKAMPHFLKWAFGSE